MSKCTIKADDFRGLKSSHWNMFLDLCRSERVPVSLGFIANGIETGESPDPRLVRKATRKDVEIWNHGLRHWKNDVDGKTEFCGPTVDEQHESLMVCQRVCEETFGKRPTCFGPPFNRFDASTLRALEMVPEIKWLYDIPYSRTCKTIPHHYYINCDAADSGRRFNLKRARTHSAPFMLRRSPFVIQIHPGNHWEDECFDKFRQFIRYVKAAGYRFVLQRGLLKSGAGL